MRKETKEVLDNLKKQADEATRSMDRDEREDLFCDLHEWAYGHYQDALIEGYDLDPEMQDYDD